MTDTNHEIESPDADAVNLARAESNSDTGVKTRSIYIILSGLTLLVMLLSLLFGTDIVGRFGQQETQEERHVHATHSLNKTPFVHPNIIGDLLGMLSDSGDQVVAINLLDSQKSNRYFGEYFVIPQTDPMLPSWPWISSLDHDVSEYEERDHTPRQEFHAYRYVGSILGDIVVLHVKNSGGGSGVFNRLLFVHIEVDYSADYPLVRNTEISPNVTTPELRRRELIRVVGKIPLGDRWQGTVELVGNEVVIRGRDLLERCQLGGTSTMEAVELKYFMDLDCKEGESDRPPSARVYKAPV